jgi:hypothetical protein
MAPAHADIPTSVSARAVDIHANPSEAVPPSVDIFVATLPTTRSVFTAPVRLHRLDFLEPDENGAVILVEGELTGHRHAIFDRATTFRDEALARDLSVRSIRCAYQCDRGHDVDLPPGTSLYHSG